MNMFWNRKLSSEWGSGAVVHMLRAATVAAVVSSCFTSAEAQEPVPLLLPLDTEAKCEAEAPLVDAIKEYAWRAYEQFSGPEKSAARNTFTGKEQLLIVNVTISYKDANGDERLLSLAATVPGQDPTWRANLQTLRVPRFMGGGDPDAYQGEPHGAGSQNGFQNDVFTTDTASPATNTRCTRISGTQYSCSF
jgi:hypothetical protein